MTITEAVACVGVGVLLGLLLGDVLAPYLRKRELREAAEFWEKQRQSFNEYCETTRKQTIACIRRASDESFADLQRRLRR